MIEPDAYRLAARFATPNPEEFGPVPIWWWSGAKLTRERLRWQMEQLLSQGIAQAVVLNLAPSGPLYGSLADDPPFMSEAWWELFLGACEDAEQLGFRFWPYDQIGFSGANLQGRLVTKRQDWAGRTIGRLSASAGGAVRLSVPSGAEPVAAYLLDAARTTAEPVEIRDGIARADAPDGTLHLVYSQPKGFDYFNREATEALLDTVHGEFQRRAGRWFGSVIVGFFQDELPGMPTWSADFSTSFADQVGYDIIPVIGALWGDPIPGKAEDQAGQVRLDYQEHRARLAQQATFDPMNQWFEANGLVCGFDQQSPAREGDPAGATRLYGDYLTLHSGYGAPGSDHWGDAKVHSSLAHAGRHPRTWLEAFHSSGWGGTLEETYDWLAPFLRRGVTLYSPHAVYYSTVGGWWEWAPPSTCWRQPYWSEYRILADAVSRLSELLSTGSHVADTALVFPTSTMQAGVLIDGTLPEAAEAGRLYHELNGHPAWYAERHGVLEDSGHDYDIFGESVLATSIVEGGTLLVGAERYRNVVLAGAVVLRADVAHRLGEFAAGGGTVIVVGEAPARFVGGPAEAFGELLESRGVLQVDSAAEVPALLAHDDVWVQADVPYLLRRVGDAWIVALFAHDSASGTVQPIVTAAGSGIEWIETSWDAYWAEITRNGYQFLPVTDRTATATVHGLPGMRVQQWDPRTGARYDLPPTVAEGASSVTVGFQDGAISVLVIAPDLPPPTTSRPGEILSEDAIEGWQLEARSLLDNTAGDFADAARGGILPIEVWAFEHWSGDADAPPSPAVVTATFGPFAEISGPAASEGPAPWTSWPAHWRPAEWSLSRGIEQDPVHGDSLGPKGYVPDEFLRWPVVATGAWVAARFTIDVPRSDVPLTLAIGANAAKSVLVDGVAVELAGDGYLATTAIAAGERRVQLWFRAEREESIRASFAVVTDLGLYRRPEWIEPAERSDQPTRWRVDGTFTLEQVPEDSRILVGSEQPCTVIVNGVEIGRQSDFDPYAERRFGRLHPYDLRENLVLGENSITLVSAEGTRRPAVLVDSVPREQGGIGAMTGSGSWEGSREGGPAPARRRSQQWQDPRFVSIEARPHPLPRAGWLDSSRFDPATVLDLIPDQDPGDRATQHLRFTLPIGATTITVPSELPFTVAPPAVVEGNRIRLSQPAHAGERMTLCFARSDGRRAGALLESAVQAEVVATSGPLVDWKELGLEAIAGQVLYRASVGRPVLTPGESVHLDLGSVRGSVLVEVDGVEAGRLAWSPYRLDITPIVAKGAGPLTIAVTVRNTLAGYLDHASPTPAIFAGQTRAGLLGPVRLTRRAAPRPG